ncbi:diguanylate cyclase domain-containing protein [Photobacterium atrarenae]|uniref:Diguanylate cyclase n=1 Tax=Photobacterium atrarenae TaxID=865757 RepID=A0ABY5GCU2_9GAMM|nr:diguanylate cyclase [Photobacterium atrarenae]UTV26681.1 diguanylate cyclase [Photobacterium atrarenae]
MSKLMRRLSLSQRLSLPVMSVIILVFLCFQFITYQNYLKIEQQNLLTRTRLLASGVGMNLTAAVLFNDPIVGNEVLSAFKADPLVAWVRLERPDHTVFARYENPAVTFIPPSPEQQHQVVSQGHYFSDDLLYLIVPVTLENEPIAHMHIAVSLETLKEMRLTHFQVSFTLLLVIFAISAYVVNRIQYWVIQPITQLNQAMTSIIKNEKPAPIHPHTYDELGELVKCFNSMQAQLNERNAKIRATLRQLSDEKAFADDIIGTVQHALIVVNGQQQIILANEACRDVLELKPLNLTGMRIEEAMHPETPDTFQAQLQAALSGQRQFDHTVVIGANPNGETRYYQITSRPLHQQLQTLFAIENVTERQQAERQQKMAAKVFDSSQDAIMILSGGGKVQMVNPAFTQYLGYEAQEVIGRHFHRFIDVATFGRMEQLILRELERTGHWQGEINQRCKSGSYIPLLVRITNIKDSHELQTVLIASDLRSMKEMKRLEHLASHDPLTNLANRSKLCEEIGHLLSTQQQSQQLFAVLFIDLDDFKQINDSYGHNAGDLVLKIIAERLNRTVRRSDLVARLAGDEFVTIIYPISQQADVVQTSERILRRIKEPIKLEQGEQVGMSASIGCYYVHPEQGLAVEDILRRADKAMYGAKLSGKGQIIEFNTYHPSQP